MSRPDPFSLTDFHSDNPIMKTPFDTDPERRRPSIGATAWPPSYSTPPGEYPQSQSGTSHSRAAPAPGTGRVVAATSANVAGDYDYAFGPGSTASSGMEWPSTTTASHTFGMHLNMNPNHTAGGHSQSQPHHPPTFLPTPISPTSAAGSSYSAPSGVSSRLHAPNSTGGSSSTNSGAPFVPSAYDGTDYSRFFLGAGPPNSISVVNANATASYPTTTSAYTNPTASSTGTSTTSLAPAPRTTLWWGELEPWMDMDYAKRVCAMMGWDPVSVKIPSAAPHPVSGVQANNPGYCFLTFGSAERAAGVLASMSAGGAGVLAGGLGGGTNAEGQALMPNSNRPFVLNWASSPGGSSMNGVGAGAFGSAVGAAGRPQQQQQGQRGSVSSDSGVSARQPPPQPPNPNTTTHHSNADSPTSSTTSTTPNAAAAAAAANAQQEEHEYSIFVGDLAPEVSNSDLVAVFRNPMLGLRADRAPKYVAPFTSCKSAKILLDPNTGVSRGYGFVRFTDPMEQQRALSQMHGLYCLTRPMRVSPATAKNKNQPPSTSGSTPGPESGPASPSPHGQGTGSMGSGMPGQGIPGSAMSPSSSDASSMHALSLGSGSAPSASTSLSSMPSGSGFDVHGGFGNPQHPQSALNTSISAPLATRPVPAGAGVATHSPTSSSIASPVPSLGAMDGNAWRQLHHAPPAPHMPMGLGMGMGMNPMGMGGMNMNIGGMGGMGVNGMGIQNTPMPGYAGLPMSPMSHAQQMHGMHQQQHPTPMSPLSLPSTSTSGSTLGAPTPLSPLSSAHAAAAPGSASDADATRALLQQNALNGEQTMSNDPYNTTVFVGGLSHLISEQTLYTFFQPFGGIHYVKVPAGKNCGFVQFKNKVDAVRAIEHMQGFPVAGSNLRLSWGRSQFKAQQFAAAQAAQLAAENQHQHVPREVQQPQPQQPHQTSPTVASPPANPNANTLVQQLEAMGIPLEQQLAHLQQLLQQQQQQNPSHTPPQAQQQQGLQQQLHQIQQPQQQPQSSSFYMYGPSALEQRSPIGRPMSSFSPFASERHSSTPNPPSGFGSSVGKGSGFGAPGESRHSSDRPRSTGGSPSSSVSSMGAHPPVTPTTHLTSTGGVNSGIGVGAGLFGSAHAHAHAFQSHGHGHGHSHGSSSASSRPGSAELGGAKYPQEEEAIQDVNGTLASLDLHDKAVPHGGAA